MIDIVSAKNARFIDATGNAIHLDVLFTHLEQEVPFTASSFDIEPHGREIHARALAGEFGPVAKFIPLIPAEIAARDNPPLRASKMAEAVDRTTHWDMMGNTAQADAWRAHYQELYVLAATPEWPLVEQWPEVPQ